MQILTPGGYKDVNILSVGDEVIGAGDEVNHIQEIDEMVYDPAEGFLDYTINGTYTYFEQQSIMANGTAYHAFELSAGDTLVDDSGNPVTITSLSTSTAANWW